MEDFGTANFTNLANAWMMIKFKALGVRSLSSVAKEPFGIEETSLG